MITAENFREKQNEITKKLSDQISHHIQQVLAEKLKEDDIKVPFIVHLDSICFYNDDIVKKTFNIIGFDVVNLFPSSDSLIATIDYVKIKETSSKNSEKIYERAKTVDDIFNRIAKTSYNLP